MSKRGIKTELSVLLNSVWFSGLLPLLRRNENRGNRVCCGTTHYSLLTTNYFLYSSTPFFKNSTKPSTERS